MGGSTGIAKLSEPRPQALHPRPRVWRKLDAAARHRLIWVSGPAGAGKTTAVQSWLAARKLGRVWYRVDAGDADPANLFHYLARTTAAPLPAKSLEISIEAFARRYFEALFARGARRRVLVLDDLHEAVGGLDGALLAALEAARPGVTIVAISRGAPPSGLARALASRDAAVVDWETLRLTTAEARGVAQALTGKRARPAAALIDSLHALSDGWPVGLALLLAHPHASELAGLEGDAIGRRLRESDGAQRIFDYVASEVFDRESESTRRFLLRSAVLPAMTERQAVALTGVPRARAILTGLGSGRLFVKSYGGAPTTYAYHPLFRAFLLDQAERRLGADLVDELRRRAGALLVDDGQLDAGFALLARARAWPACAAIAIRGAPVLVGQGRQLTLAAWLAALPPDIVQASPWLLYWQATCTLAFAPLASAALLGDALARFRAEGDLTGARLAWSARVAACVHAGTDLAPIDGWLAELAELDGDGAPVTIGHLLALFRQPGNAHAPAWVRDALDHWRAIADPSQRTMTAALLIPTCCFSGELGRAATVIDALRRAEGPGGVDSFAQVTLCNGEAVFAWATADNAACLGAVARGLALATATGIVVWNDQLAALGAAAALATGDLAAARPYLDRMRRAAGTTFAIGNYHFYAAWDAQVRGETAHALAAIEIAIVRADAFGYPLAQVTSRLAGAQVRASLGEAPGAWLAEARALVAAARSPFLTFSCAIAEACLATGELRDEAIARAFGTGRALGIYNVFWWLREPIVAICERALERGIEPAYVTELVQRHRLAPSPGAPAAWPYPVVIRALGKLEVALAGAPLVLAKKGPHIPLRLLAAIIALGGREVAEARLVEALWPDADGASGRTVLHTTLHRLRRQLGRDDAIRVHGGAIGLEPSVVWLDTWALERALVQLERCASAGAVAAVADAEDQLFALYRGPLLDDDEAPAWIAAARLRSHGRIMRAILAAGRFWETRRELDRARALYERALERDDASEAVYQRLMTCLDEAGQGAEALRLYERCELALASQRGLGPSRITREIRARIHRQLVL